MRKKGVRRAAEALCVVLLVCASPARARPDAIAEGKLPPELRFKIDRAAQEILASTGVPSASVAIVRDGQIAYVQAYGDARLDPRAPARPDMRYSIGSISKQFTATAILMLAQERKLSLDEPVSRFLPDLTRSGEVTIRELLSHTSGYQDYWPQDYVPPFMLRAITAQEILDRWAKKPLDFPPGTQWQYSNTNYVIAGMIVEKASAMTLPKFLQARIFGPLAMTSVTDVDQAGLGQSDPAGYLRYALGPLRAAPKEGRGWLFAAGELAMTAEDLARWNIGMIGQRLLTASSYREMETEVLLKNGLGTRYGLGVGVTTLAGRRALAHGGEVSGFTAQNVVFPDDSAAITVLTNEDASSAASAIAHRIAPLLLEGKSSVGAEAKAREILESLQRGKIDRSLFTANANAYFTEQALEDFASSLGPLGKPQVKQTAQRDRGGMTFRSFEATFSKKSVVILERDLPDGKIEQYQVMAKD